MIGGYLAMVLVYMAGMLLVTRLGRKVLMDGDCVSNTYTILLCGTWLVAALAGAMVACRNAPLPPYGPEVLPLVVALAAILLVRRNVLQSSGQQSMSATIGIVVMILVGTSGAMHLQHVF